MRPAGGTLSLHSAGSGSCMSPAQQGACAAELGVSGCPEGRAPPRGPPRKRAAALAGQPHPPAPPWRGRAAAAGVAPPAPSAGRRARPLRMRAGACVSAMGIRSHDTIVYMIAYHGECKMEAGGLLNKTHPLASRHACHAPMQGCGRRPAVHAHRDSNSPSSHAPAMRACRVSRMSRRFSSRCGCFSHVSVSSPVRGSYLHACSQHQRHTFCLVQIVGMSL